MSVMAVSTVPLAEAKNKLSELVERVLNGEEIIITRHDRPAAKLVPAGPLDRQKVRVAIERMTQLRKECPATLKEIIAWKNEGRP
jgi:prevent-host-death family protein